MVNGKLETLQLIQRFGVAETHRQVHRQKACIHALCVCLLHCYLQGPPTGHAESILLDFAQQISKHIGFTSLVLAESLMGPILWPNSQAVLCYYRCAHVYRFIIFLYSPLFYFNSHVPSTHKFPLFSEGVVV